MNIKGLFVFVVGGLVWLSVGKAVIQSASFNISSLIAVVLWLFLGTSLLSIKDDSK